MRREWGLVLNNTIHKISESVPFTDEACNLLSKELGQLSARDFARVSVARTSMLAACSFCNELWSEGCVELTTSHTLLILG